MGLELNRQASESRTRVDCFERFLRTLSTNELYEYELFHYELKPLPTLSHKSLIRYELLLTSLFSYEPYVYEPSYGYRSS